MVLSTREKLMVGVLIALLLAAGLWFGIGGARARLAQAETRVRAQEALLQKAVALTGELQRLEQPGPRRRTAAGQSPVGYVEQLADRVGIKDRIQLNVLPQESRSGLQVLDVRVTQLSLDELVHLLYILEDADYRMVIDQIELSPSFRNKDLLRLSMRILARQ